MTPRRTKRFINAADEFLVFTKENSGSKAVFRILPSTNDAWEILLNLSINDHFVRETLRNIISVTDEHIKNSGDSSESGES